MMLMTPTPEGMKHFHDDSSLIPFDTIRFPYLHVGQQELRGFMSGHLGNEGPLKHDRPKQGVAHG